jgi:biotin transport system substrate-specific component
MMSSSFSLPVNCSVKATSWLKDLLIIAAASIIISLSAYITIPLPFTPVPLVLQCHMVLLMAAMLGSKKGTLATLLFIAQGMFGLPVFAGGNAGVLCLVGPTGGYLLGYVAAAFLTGYIVDILKEKSNSKVLIAMTCGNLVIYLFGMTWLSSFIGFNSAFTLGVLPFIIGDAFKLIFCTRIFKFSGCVQK